MNKIVFYSLWLFSLFCFAGAIAQGSKTKEDTDKIDQLLNKARQEYTSARYDKALEPTIQALEISFTIDDNFQISQCYNALGIIYSESGDFQKSNEFYQKALIHAKKVNNDRLFCKIYGNLGNFCYFNGIDVNKGIQYYKKSLHYAIKAKDKTYIVYAKLDLASSYFSLKKYDVGNRYIKEIKDEILKQADDESSKFALYSLMGTYASHKNNKILAEQYFSKAEKIAEENKLVPLEINIYENLVEHYKHYKEYQKALFCQEKLDSIRKAVNSPERKEKIKKTGEQIQFNVYKNQLEKIEKESQKRRLTLKESKLIVILFLIILIVLLVLLLTLYKNTKLRDKVNSELKKVNEELVLAKERAEEASRIKSQFVSTITHELRTPLYGVIGITNIILDEHKELTNSPHLKSLKFSAKYLLSLVNDILQINKIEEKKVVLENLIFNLTDEIATIKNSVEYIADKNNDKLTIEIDTAIPEFLIGDKLRLSQIIMNLASNALKFTKNGEVIVSAELKRVEGKIHFIEFKIKDTGVGIPKEHQAKIFDKFVQIERKEDDYQGTGLGLSIVTSLIGLFGSEIHLESEENVGSLFWFTIGFEYDEGKSQDIINEIEVDLSQGRVYNILVVEDNKINQLVTKKIIESSNMNCVMVDDGYTALATLDRGELFDAVLMDINMPLINGFDTTRKIREKGFTLPIIALTAFDKQEVTEEAFSAGMNDIMVKPFERNKLIQVISNQIKGNENAG